MGVSFFQKYYMTKAEQWDSWYTLVQGLCVFVKEIVG
jgi:hypothetical protein